MKKSNIILLSLLLISIFIMIIVQLKVKSTIIETEKFTYNYEHFSNLEIHSGWVVELQKDTITQVTISNDSIKHLISQTKNTLVLMKNGKHRNVISISNPTIKNIKIAGNSTLRYYTESSLDSLKAILNDESDLFIYNTKNPAEEHEKKIKYTINYLNIDCSDKSNLNIYPNVNILEGFLNDTSSLRIRGNFKVRNLEKSEKARITSW